MVVDSIVGPTPVRAKGLVRVVAPVLPLVAEAERPEGGVLS